jgi:hypothetical protein
MSFCVVLGARYTSIHFLFRVFSTQSYGSSTALLFPSSPTPQIPIQQTDELTSASPIRLNNMPRRGADDEEWEVHKEEILERYKKENLKVMMAWMATQRGFDRRHVIQEISTFRTAANA